jgi:metal-responsive CopG/Arc/MetJ family transcriptional regulator
MEEIKELKKGYMIKSVYIREEYWNVWDEFEKILKDKKQSQSVIINELIKKYVEEEKNIY